MKKLILPIITLLGLSYCSDNKKTLDTENIVTKYADSVKTAIQDSICTYDEIVGDPYKHFIQLANSIPTKNYYFNSITQVFKNHTTDTSMMFKTENILLLKLDDYNGLAMHIKGLRKLRRISYDSLKVDTIQLVKFYPGLRVIKDDDIIEDTSKSK
jgi:hypothetical protein